eukprot:2521328-Amphidinium_carterae.1
MALIGINQRLSSAPQDSIRPPSSDIVGAASHAREQLYRVTEIKGRGGQNAPICDNNNCSRRHWNIHSLHCSQHLRSLGRGSFVASVRDDLRVVDNHTQRKEPCSIGGSIKRNVCKLCILWVVWNSATTLVLGYLGTWGHPSVKIFGLGYRLFFT